MAVISTILSSNSFIRSSSSVILLLIPHSLFLITVIVLFIIICCFFSSSISLLNISFLDLCLYSIPRFCILFIVITLNSFSGRLPISSLFICSCGFYLAPLSTTYFCLIILSNIFAGCRVIVPLASVVCFQWVKLVQWLV